MGCENEVLVKYNLGRYTFENIKWLAWEGYDPHLKWGLEEKDPLLNIGEHKRKKSFCSNKIKFGF